MNTELLSVRRASQFIDYCLQHDMQVKVNRGTALMMLQSAIARPGDQDNIEFGSEKFDKIATFLSSTDAQVHYAGPTNTVGVYAITRLLGELRRQIRDTIVPGAQEGGYLNMMSPRIPSGVATARQARQAAAPQPDISMISAAELEEVARNAQRAAAKARQDEQDEYLSQVSQRGGKST